MPGVITSEWQYAAFASQETVEARLAMATLHEAEVRKAAVEQGTGHGRYTRLPMNYLTDLTKLVETYRAEIRLATVMAASSVARQTPVNLRPRF